MSLESRVLREAAYNLSGTDPQETKAAFQMAANKIDELRAKLAEMTAIAAAHRDARLSYAEKLAADAAQNSQLLE